MKKLFFFKGSNSKCGLYQCCDTVNGIPVDPEDGSAFWYFYLIKKINLFKKI